MNSNKCIAPILTCFMTALRTLANLQHFLIGTSSFLDKTLAGYTPGQCRECTNLTMQNKTWRLQAHHKLCPSVCARCLVQTTWFIRIYVSFFCPTHKCQNDAPNCGTKKTDMMMNNHSNNLNGSNMHDLWVLKRLCTKACENEFHYPWHNMCDSDYM